jgi:hypothetical protein
MKLLAIRLSWQTTPAKSLVMFERAAAANRGRLFFGYFLFGEAKESD